MLRLSDRRHLLPGTAAFAAALAAALLGLNAAADEPPAPPPSGTVELQLLGVNDFHGHLEAPAADIGGAAWLSAHLHRAAVSHPGRTITVHAGDMVGASPLVSSYFHDEPTIEATNRMGFDVGTVGNHELDEGGAEMLRLLRGGPRTDGPRAFTSDPGWQGARYPYLAANTIDRATGRPILPPYQVVRRAGVRVGFIGVTTEDTAQWLLPEHRAPYRFADISDTVNEWTDELRRRGVEAIVVLAHSGAFGSGVAAAGEIVDETAEMDDAVDVVVGGHSHSELNLTVGGKLVVESEAYGAGFERVALTVDRTSGDIVAKSALLVPTRHRGVAPDPDLARFVAARVARVAPVGERVVTRLDRAVDADGLGELAADAQRAFTGADIAFVNPGSTRRPGLAAGPVTFAELFAVHAYEHPVLRLRMRGSDVLALIRGGSGVKLHASGLEEVDPGGVYSVAANGVLAAGERFGAFDRALARETVGTDLEALVAWLSRAGG